ncbi:hypothetical protein N8I77_013189 [Diaporthe amygdali]|uniref:Clr5 domain-containing protein n=1 Tax=Phomopsis amygdali TaxID=1214568 RepID=A0AAD9S225_PHOAM|nr:hypothetical protein N8I77_013189 [Diaporthe amygdali]
MPAHSRAIPVRSADDVWHRHESQIKDLYQNQRKTLEEVKHLMEEKGFPKKPLSTWESKLRETLRLRKRANAKDWPLIYQHILPRLKHPKKKALKKKTRICLNNSEILWDKAWKEIRRSRALEMDFQSNKVPPASDMRFLSIPEPAPAWNYNTDPIARNISFTNNTASSSASSVKCVDTLQSYHSTHTCTDAEFSGSTSLANTGLHDVFFVLPLTRMCHNYSMARILPVDATSVADSEAHPAT